MEEDFDGNMEDIPGKDEEEKSEEEESGGK